MGWWDDPGVRSVQVSIFETNVTQLHSLSPRVALLTASFDLRSDTSSETGALLPPPPPSARFFFAVASWSAIWLRSLNTDMSSCLVALCCSARLESSSWEGERVRG